MRPRHAVVSAGTTRLSVVPASVLALHTNGAVNSSNVSTARTEDNIEQPPRMDRMPDDILHKRNKHMATFEIF